MSDKLPTSNITAKYSLGEQPRDPTIIGALTLAAVEAAGVSGAVAFGSAPVVAGLGITGAQLVGGAIILGASIGASLLLAPSGGSKPLEKNDVTVRQAVPARFVDIGRVKTGGVIFFWDAVLDSAPRWTLFIGTILSCSEINDVETVYLNDDQPTWTGSYENQSIAQCDPYGDNFTAKGAYTSLETGRGAATDGPPAFLNLYWGWTTSDKNLVGLAYSVIAYGQGDDPSLHANLYPQGPPAVTAVIKGCKLPDPTTGVDMSNLATWAYHDNSARAVLRYLLDVDGWRLPVTDIDQAMFESATAWCGEVTSGEARYRSWGRYTTTEERRGVLADLLEACDGKLIEQPTGKAGLIVGRLVASNISLTEADIIEAQWEPYGDTLDRVGSVRPRFVWEDQNWQEWDLTPVELATPDADQALKQIDLPLKFCPSPLQAWRLAGARLRALNPRWRGTITTRLVGLQAFGDRWIDIQFAPLGIDQQFEIIDGIALNLATMTCTMNVRSVESDDYDWGDD